MIGWIEIWKNKRKKRVNTNGKWRECAENDIGNKFVDEKYNWNQSFLLCKWSKNEKNHQEIGCIKVRTERYYTNEFQSPI
jgi:hypothetical protein